MFNVVALISAVTVQSGQVRVLATPIQPTIPGTGMLLSREPGGGQGDMRPKRSMTETVRRINQQVAAHAIWTVEPEMENDEPTGDIIFRYESVADPPNIGSIEVDFESWGEQVGGESSTRIALANPGVDSVPNLPPDKRQPRVFKTSAISDVGRSVYEPGIAAASGSISFVRLYITPHYADEQIPVRTIMRELSWAASRPR